MVKLCEHYKMKRMKIFNWLYIIQLSLIIGNTSCTKVDNNYGSDKVLPFSNESVTLTESWIKDREDLNTEYLKSLDPDRLLHNFRVNAGLPSYAEPLEGWESPNIGLRGHFTGHYLSAISSLVEKYNDSIFITRLNYMVDELYICQQALGENGYLSAFAERDFDVLETRFGGVWAPYYTYNKIMQGLLDAYIRGGNDKAFEMVKDMASYVDLRMSKLDDETIEKILYTTQANPGNEAGAMNEVLFKLYELTEDPQHLELAEIFSRDWFLNSLVENEDILSGLHSNTHIVLVNGFAEGYEVTKDKKYRDAVVNFWDILIDHHAYVNGSSSGPRPNVTTQTSLTAEHWGEPDHLSSTMTKEIAESCVSHNTQKLSSSLFQWTANPKYADAYMNTFYNSILALQSAETGRCVYHLPLGSPRRKSFLNENDFRCCNGSSIEAFAQLNSGIYYHNDESLFVNLYVPSKLIWAEKEISLEQSGNFPNDSTIEFTVSSENNSTFQINLFIPSWAKSAEVFINDEKQNIKITRESYVELNREWQNNDKIKLVFNYDFYIKSMPDNKNVIAIFYGPTLLAFEDRSEIIVKGDTNTILNKISKVSDDCFELWNDKSKFTLTPFYNIENESYGVYATIRNY